MSAGQTKLKKLYALFFMFTMDFTSIDENSLQSGGVIFVRHGQTDWKYSMLGDGPLDLPLSDRGRKSVEKCAESLKDLKIEKIYSSPLLRAQETAEIISGIIDLPVIIEDDLKEKYFGDFRLLPESERNKSFRPPDAEDKSYFESRVKEAYDKLITDNPGKLILIVSHEKVFKCLVKKLYGQKKNIPCAGKCFFPSDSPAIKGNL